MSRRSCSRVRCGALVALLLASTSCASAGNARRARDDAGAIRVVVDNGGWLDMNVYVESETGARIRIGTVIGSTSRTFTLRTQPFGGGWFRLVGDPIGSSDMRRSDVISLAPGSTAHWRVGPNPASSWLIVR